MSGFFLFGAILVILLTAIVWAAFRAGEDTGARLTPGERRDAAIEALRDLELEHRTGKLTDDEYRAVRARLEGEALEARDAADAGSGSGIEPDGTGDGDRAACAACSAPLDGDEVFCSACGASAGGD